jgi:hypothetical protein
VALAEFRVITPVYPHDSAKNPKKGAELMEKMALGHQLETDDSE